MSFKNLFDNIILNLLFICRDIVSLLLDFYENSLEQTGSSIMNNNINKVSYTSFPLGSIRGDVYGTALYDEQFNAKRAILYKYSLV